MAPAATKRKRNGRNYSNDANEASQRPSPHRPQNLALAQQSQNSGGASVNRRSGRGNRGTNQGPVRSPPLSTQPPATTRTGMSPPPSAPTKTPTPSDAASKSDPPSSAVKPNLLAPSSAAYINSIPYIYQFVTDHRISKWKVSGHGELMTDAQKYVQSQDVISLGIVFQELTRAVVSERLDPSQAGAAVKEILEGAETSTELTLPGLFLDCVTSVVEAGLQDHTNLWNFLTSTGVSPSLMREQLESSLLIALNLVRSSFTQMGTRYTTGVLYKQTTYNLLREDTEGFAKLITEYFSTAEYLPPSSEVASDSFQKVKALIGTFNLDPGRTLDITLDVFANLLVRRYRYFVKFLRASSFWPKQKFFAGVEHENPGFGSLPIWATPDYPGWSTSEDDRRKLEGLKEQRDIKFWKRVQKVGVQAYFEIGGRQILNQDNISEVDNGVEAVQDEDQQWISATKTYPPHGNKIAAQLLGFKLRFYASDSRDKSDVLPENIIFLAALLIHIGFISLRDLYPHLYPPDEAMAAVKEKLLKEKEEREMKKRPGGGQNALTMAGALFDDTIPHPRLREPQPATSARPEPLADKSAATTKDEDEEKSDLPEPENQKIVLLRSLLLIGAIPEALFILGRFPWLIDACPELPEHIHRILHYSLSKVYTPLQPLFDRETVREPKLAVGEQSGLSKGQLKTASPNNRKILRWAKLDSYDASNQSDYKYYFDEWNDNVPLCQNVDDVFDLCKTFLNLSGVRIGQDPELLSKLARIGRCSIAEDQSEANVSRWMDLSKRILVPALSLTKGNTGAVNEVWELIKSFSIQTRFSIYAEWYSGPTSRHPEMKVAFDQTRAEAKDVLKRISKTNARTMARALGKVADASPGVVYAVTLNQIEAYENLIDVVVEGARYFTPLGFDVLTWSILNSLGGGGRNRVQADGMLTSPWLRALSVFAGNTFRHYKTMNPSPILKYVANQLRKGNSTDLEILEQIVNSMAGIRSDTSYGEEQVQALSGGPLLRDLILRQVYDKRHESRSQTRRLIKALNETNLAGDLLVLIAHERQVYIFRESANDAPLKVLGNNLDKIHDAFVQYLDMLRSNLSTEEFDAVVPPISTLISEFGLDPSVAFAICRPSIQAWMHKEDRKPSVKDATTTSPPPTTNGDVPMLDVATEATAAITDGKARAEVNTDNTTEVEMADVSTISNESDNSPKRAATPTPWHPVLETLMDELKPVLRDGFEEHMSISFYVRFWQLSLHDMFIPSYETETKRLQVKLAAVNADRSDVSREGVKRKETEKKRLTDLQDGLRNEMKSHIASYQAVRKKLGKEKDHWFVHIPPAKHSLLSDAIIQECLFPRIILSPSDAQFAARFIFFAHQQGTPAFRTLHIFDRMLREQQILATLFQCTAREAENFGRFLHDILKELRQWRIDKATFEKVGLGGPKKQLPGLATKLNPDLTPKDIINYEQFRRILFRWHIQLGDAMKACLKSGEYMHIRNGCIVLKAVHKQWPEVNFQGDQVQKAITELSINDERQDLKLSALSLLGDLKKRSTAWVLPQTFRLGDVPQSKEPSRSTSARPEKSQPALKPSKPLDPKVPEFKSNTASNGSTMPAASKGDVEDGEIEDAKKSEAAAALRKDSGTVPKPDTQPNVPVPSSGGDNVPQAAENKLEAQPDRQPPNGTSQPVAASRSEARRVTLSQLPPVPTQHALPNRPEGDIPGRERISHLVGAERNLDRSNYRQGSELTQGRLERPADLQRDNRQRHESPGQRSRNRSPERIPPSDRDRRELIRDQPRDLLREPPRDAREQYDRTIRPPPRDARSNARGQDWNEPPPRDRGYDLGHSLDGPSRNPAAASATMARAPVVRDPPMNIERAARLQQPPSSSGGTPEQSDRSDRMAMDRDPSRRHEDRSDRNTRSARNSRHPSPRPGEDLPTAGPSRLDSPRYDHREERGAPHERPPTSDYHQPNRERRDDAAGFTPSGPRANQPGRYDTTEGAPRPRELIQPPHGRHGGSDFSLPPRPTPQQDPNYGRLNPLPEAPPSGPRNTRQTMGRGGRNFSAQTQPPRSMDFNGPAPVSSTAEHPPAAAGPDWRDRRISAPANQSGSRMASGPPTPVTEQPPATIESATIHPSRAAFVQQAPLAVDVSSVPASSAPPSGPRLAQRQGAGNFAPLPSPTARNPPAGPASTAERRDSRHFANLSSHLQQAANSTSDQNGRTLRVRGRALGQGGNGQNPAPSAATNPPTMTMGGPNEQLPVQAAPPPAVATSRADASRAMAPPERMGRMPLGPPEMDHQEDRPDGGRSSRRQDSTDKTFRRHKSDRSRSPRHDREDMRQRDELRPSGREERQPLPSQEGYREREQRKQQSAGSDRDGRERRPHKDRENEVRRELRGRAGDSARAPPPQSGLPPFPPARESHPQVRRNPMYGNEQWDARGPMQGLPPPPPRAIPPSELRNGERELRSRGGHGGERKDDRRESQGDGRKRGRAGGDDGMIMDMEPKRPRRGQ